MPSKPRAKIVARLTQEQLNALYETHFQTGYSQAKRDMREAEAALQRQREQLSVAQTDAVTKLIEACNANLSKAGYLIGKLNKDTSR